MRTQSGLGLQCSLTPLWYSLTERHSCRPSTKRAEWQVMKSTVMDSRTYALRASSAFSWAERELVA